MSHYRCLSVKQPWASLIASGRKTIELRTWRTRYRGPLIICAGLSPRRGTEFEIGPLGVSICVVDLVDVREPLSGDDLLSCCDVSPRELAWVLKNPRRFPAIPVKGMLSLFAPPPELAALVAK
jgi:hypothetical protein